MSSEAHNVDTGAESGATEVDKINTGALGTLVTVGLFAMIAITAAVTALVRHDISEEEDQKATEENRVVSELKAAQQSKLNGPASYIDRGKGVVSLPITLAKGLVLGDLARDPSSATPAKPAPSAAVDSAAGAATLGEGGAATHATDAGKGAGKPSEANPPSLSKPELGRNVSKPPVVGSALPLRIPTPTPTAASPGAQSPGPTNK